MRLGRRPLLAGRFVARVIDPARVPITTCYAYSSGLERKGKCLDSRV